MNNPPHRPHPAERSPNATWSDERLVRECLGGNEAAWATLIDRYKNLIFSIPIKYGATRDVAADVFQAVCLDLFSELSRLRNVGALRSWLISIAVHKSFHWKRNARKQSAREAASVEQEEPRDTASSLQELIEGVEREQMVREAVARLPSRCAELVRLLFYEQPPIPYEEVAQRMSLATGSIGFIRGRCLRKLQRILESMGF
jgi:RNA polymerase sigma factor (sigma-70 family)